MTGTARAFLAAQMMLREPIVALPSLVMITADPQVLEGLSGVHAQRRLGRHIRSLAKHIINQAHGIDDGSLERAISGHGAQNIFGRFPEAVAGVFDALGFVTNAYRRRGGELLGEQYDEFGEFINHLAGLHGFEESPTTTDRADRIGRRVLRLIANDIMPASDGPGAFWDVVLEPETLELFGLANTASTVHTAIGLIRETIPWPEITDRYTHEGKQRLALL